METPTYVLSADPLTKGHTNIIERIIKTFGKVLVGIGINPKKKYTFSLEEREQLTRKVLAPYGDQVTVKSYRGLLTDFAYENGIKTVVRGARSSADFDFERLLADINGGLSSGLETYIMIADPNLSHISSSAVKELQEHQAKNISDYVHPVVKEALELRISGQFRIGITGGIGNGKSYVEKKLIEIDQHFRNCIRESALHQYPKFHSIDMDVIGRYILKESEEPLHKTIRNKIAEKFGKNLIYNGMIDVKSLLRILFDEPESSSTIHDFEDIMAEPIMHLVRKNLINKKGIVLISSALFVEQGICDLVNNNFIFVNCPEDVRMSRLKKRGYSPLEIENRLKAQLSSEAKLCSITKLIRDQSCGELIEFENIDNNDSDLEALYYKIKEIYGKKL